MPTLILDKFTLTRPFPTNPRCPQQAGCSVVNVLNDDNPYAFHPVGVGGGDGRGHVTFAEPYLCHRLRGARQPRQLGVCGGAMTAATPSRTLKQFAPLRHAG